MHPTAPSVSGCLLFLSKRIQRRRGKVPPTMEDDGQHNDHPKKRATRAPQDVFLMKFQKQLKLYRSRKTKSD
ncbi:hypothetical protein SORBI_3009G053001 [Sorghum bicolor]|uniref:Uncharacterized protein n=1 Tax=Sorghum bicolor TaxID=4558 RepID=A0A1Z5R105_SORBI|nr:hypothetical protein SORBI_3009G053001 [Sorghum bicolor]